MPLETLSAYATLRVRHERPYEFDEGRGVWLFKRLDEDEEYRNILTNAGRVSIHTYVYGTTPQRVSAGLGTGLNFVALSNSVAVPAPGDTSLAGELTTNGLGRVAGLVTLPTGAGTITQIQHQFTYTGGGTQGVQKTALFDALSAGNMAHEILFTQRTLATNDAITLIFNLTLT